LLRPHTHTHTRTPRTGPGPHLYDSLPQQCISLHSDTTRYSTIVLYYYHYHSSSSSSQSSLPTTPKSNLVAASLIRPSTFHTDIVATFFLLRTALPSTSRCQIRPPRLAHPSVIANSALLLCILILTLTLTLTLILVGPSITSPALPSRPKVRLPRNLHLYYTELQLPGWYLPRRTRLRIEDRGLFLSNVDDSDSRSSSAISPSSYDSGSSIPIQSA